MSSTQLPSTLRRISADDNTAIANVIRQVSAEHGLTADKATWWPAPIWMNWVVEQNGQVVGGGVALLGYSEPDICELQKMYFLPSGAARGWRKSWC